MCLVPKGRSSWCGAVVGEGVICFADLADLNRFGDHGCLSFNLRGRKAWVLDQRQPTHPGRWWWPGPPLSLIDLGALVQAVWVGECSLSQEINAVVRRIILNLEESCAAVQQVWNPSENLEFVADWQIGRLVGQDYGSGEEDWCLSTWEA